MSDDGFRGESESRFCDCCSLWDTAKAQDGYGQCQHPPHLDGKVKMSECWHDIPKGEYPPLMLIVEHAGKRYPASTHPKFGCRHWKGRDNGSR
jgi:hypothetical protein